VVVVAGATVVVVTLGAAACGAPTPLVVPAVRRATGVFAAPEGDTGAVVGVVMDVVVVGAAVGREARCGRAACDFARAAAWAD
jgi:hypothetical protein